MDTKFTSGFLSYDGKFNDIFSLSSNIGISNKDHAFAYGSPNYEPINFLNKQSDNSYKEDILQGGLKLTADFMHDFKLRALVGLDYKNIDVKTRATRLDKNGARKPFQNYNANEKNISPYAQIEYKPIDYALFLAGVRMDSFDSDGKKIEATNPNFGISIFPFANTDYDYTTLWASYSESFRTPTSPEKFLPKFLGGNPDLSPEKSKGWEIGLKQRLSTWGNLELSYYETDYEDLIRLIRLPGDGYNFLFKNEGETTLKGFEISSEFYPTNHLILYLAYNQSELEDTAIHKRLYGNPDKTFKYGFSIVELYGFDFTTQARNYRDFKFSNGKPHPSNNKTIIDTKLIYNLNLSNNIKLKPFVEINNLTDETYYTFSSGGSIEEKRTYSVGLNFKYIF